MFTRFILPLAALTGICLGIYGVSPYRLVVERKTMPISQPIQDPPEQPPGLQRIIAGAGIIEARMENIPIGTTVPGVVTEVYVDGRPGHKRVGDRVQRGEPLFKIDDRELRAQLEVRLAALGAAEAQLRRLEELPRPEDLPPAEAAVEEARARLLDAQAAYDRDLPLFQKKLLAASDFDKIRYALQAAKAALEKAEADLARLKAGAWQEDLEVARAACEQARSEVRSVQMLIDRLVVRAPVDGQVLKVNVRPGQFAALVWDEPMIVLGDVTRLHVRVDVDENDLPRFMEGARAWATIKGQKEPRFPLEFVRIEPYVIPKRSLTGENAERVDTRVLQVLYALPDELPQRLYVGQQMDVFLDVGPISRHMAEGPAETLQLQALAVSAELAPQFATRPEAPRSQ
jgi:HlyD family secretion protein